MAEKKINYNYKNNNKQQNKIVQNEREENNEIIIELEIFNKNEKNEFNILCDKEQLIKDNKKYENYFKKII